MAGSRIDGLVSSTNVLRIPIHSVEESAMPDVFAHLLDQPGVNQIVMLRWWDFMRARSDREYRRCLTDAALCIPVSRSITVGARFLHHVRPARHLPFDFTIRLLGALEDSGRSIYLLGGTPTTLRTVEQNLRETFPGVRFVGRYTGYFGPEVEADIITAIRKADPDLILLGGGIAAGDKWVARHRSELGSCVALYSPETFDIFADRRTRTSRTAFRRGTDFIPGLLRRPWRILRLPAFLWYLLLLLVFRVFRL